MNHIFVKGSVLGVEPQDIENRIVTPLSRPFKDNDHDKAFGTNSLYSSITPLSIPKQSFLNPTTLDFNLLTESNTGEEPQDEKLLFNKTTPIDSVLKEINQKDVPTRDSFSQVKLTSCRTSSTE